MSPLSDYFNTRWGHCRSICCVHFFFLVPQRWYTTEKHKKKKIITRKRVIDPLRYCVLSTVCIYSSTKCLLLLKCAAKAETTFTFAWIVFRVVGPLSWTTPPNPFGSATIFHLSKSSSHNSVAPAGALQHFVSAGPYHHPNQMAVCFNQQIYIHSLSHHHLLYY